MLAADCQQFCVVVPLTKCNCTCVSASQKASGSEAVTEAGSKDASAVTKAGQYFLRASTIFKHYVQVLHNPNKIIVAKLYVVTLLQNYYMAR